MIKINGFTKHFFQYGVIDFMVERDDQKYLSLNGMQKQVRSLYDERLGIIKAATGSGKSVASFSVAWHKMKQDPKLVCIFAVPQNMIRSNFMKGARFMFGKKKVDFQFSDMKGSQAIVELLSDRRSLNPQDRTLCCTTNSLVDAFQGKPDVFKNCFLVMDESHHIQYNEGLEERYNEQGKVVSHFIDNYKRLNLHLLLMSATFFRGDRMHNIAPDKIDMFKTVYWSTAQHLESEYMRPLSSINYDFLLHRENYWKCVGELYEKVVPTVIYLPHPGSLASVVDKKSGVKNVLAAIAKKLNGKVEYKNYNGYEKFFAVVGGLKFIDLVDDDDDNLRKKKMDYIANVKSKRDLHGIIAVGMFKEGADWVYAQREVFVGTKGSLVDVLQMMGRMFRQPPDKDKETVEVHHLLYCQSELIEEGRLRTVMNNYLKSIYLSMAIEDVVTPVKLKVTNGSRSYEDLDEGERLGLFESSFEGMMDVDEDSYKDTDKVRKALENGVRNELNDLNIPDEEHEDIVKRIWNMLIGRLNSVSKGVDVSQLEMELVSAGNPLAYFIRFSSVFGVKSFVELREVCVKDSILKMEKLLKMAAAGEPRPKKKSKDIEEVRLGRALCQYTNKTQMYKPEFDIKIRELRPDWFLTAQDTKNELLEMAMRGEKRPHSNTTLGRCYNNYKSEKSRMYDVEFVKKIKKACPDWFEKQVDKFKNELIQMAIRGEKRPPMTTKIGSALYCYTNKNRGQYDPKFDVKIKKLRPDWFEDNVKLIKEELIRMAIRGEKRPTRRGGIYGATLARCTTTSQAGNGYDPEFETKIKNIRPDWFENSADKNREELIKMAMRGEKRPSSTKTVLGKLLSHYTSKSSYSYNIEFDTKIRKLRPDWFPVSKKEQLLLYATDKNNERPVVRSPLGSAMHAFTSKASKYYDEEFDIKIRKLRPDWFAYRRSTNGRLVKINETL